MILAAIPSRYCIHKELRDTLDFTPMFALRSDSGMNHHIPMSFTEGMEKLRRTYKPTAFARHRSSTIHPCKIRKGDVPYGLVTKIRLVHFRNPIWWPRPTWPCIVTRTNRIAWKTSRFCKHGNVIASRCCLYTQSPRCPKPSDPICLCFLPPFRKATKSKVFI